MGELLIEGSVNKQLRRALEDWNIVNAEAILSSEENNEKIREQSMDLVSMVCEYLTTQNEAAGPHLTQCCEDLLVTLAVKGSAKENIISLLEHLEGFKDLKLVRRVLPALSLTMINIKDKSKSHAWSWALETLGCHLKTIKQPENSGLEGAERLTLDLNTTNSDINDFIDDLVPFLKPLVDYCKSAEQSKENSLRKEHIIKFICQIFGHPLAYLSQHPEKSKKGVELLPRSYASSSEFLTFISILVNNMLTSMLGISDKDGLEDYGDYKICLGVYFYLVFGESFSIECLPQMYSHIFLLRCCSKFIIHMLESDIETINHKGLLLLASLLNRIPENWLQEGISHDPELTSIIQPLSNVIIHHNTAELRSLGFKCYQLLATRFDIETRFDWYRFLFNTLNHSGLLGWTVTHFKDTLRKVYMDKNASYPSYSDNRLTQIFTKLFQLKHGAQTDLLEISDEIIAEVNLAYFIICQKSTIYGVDIKEWVQNIEEGLKLTKAHWELELQNTKSNKKSDSAVNSNEPELSVTIGSQSLPAMEPKQKIENINLALTTLDVIQFNFVPLVNKLEQMSKQEN